MLKRLALFAFLLARFPLAAQVQLGGHVSVPSTTDSSLGATYVFAPTTGICILTNPGSSCTLYSDRGITTIPASTGAWAGTIIYFSGSTELLGIPYSPGRSFAVVNSTGSNLTVQGYNVGTSTFVGPQTIVAPSSTDYFVAEDSGGSLVGYVLIGPTPSGNVTNPNAVTPVFTGNLAANVIADYSGNEGTGTTLSDISGANFCSGSPCDAPFAAGALAPSWINGGVGFLGLANSQGAAVPSTASVAMKSIVMSYYLYPITQTPGGAVTLGNYTPLLSNTLGTNGITLIGNAAPCIPAGVATPVLWTGGGCKTLPLWAGAGFHTMVLTLGTSSGDPNQMYIDGAVVPYSSNTFSFGQQSSGNIYFGSANVSPFNAQGSNWILYRARLYSSELTAADALQVTQIFKTLSFNAGVAIVPTPTLPTGPVIHGDGDSQMSGVGTTTPWVNELTLTTPYTYTVKNWGLAGMTQQGLTASDATRIAPQCTTFYGTPAIVFDMGGANDFSNNNISGAAAAASAVFNSTAADIKLFVAAGCDVYVDTLYDRFGTDGGGNSFSSDNEALNVLIRQYASTLHYTVADNGANPLIGAAGSSTSGGGTYFQSGGLHTTQAGNDIQAAEASNAVNARYGSTASSPTIVTATTFTMLAGSTYISNRGTAASTYTLPSCYGQTNAIYTIDNTLTAFPVTLVGFSTTQLVNGANIVTSNITIPALTKMQLQDVAIGGTTAGCGWSTNITSNTSSSSGPSGLPTCTVQTGAGTGATCALATGSTNTGGVLTLVTGTATVTNTQVVRINYNGGPLANAPNGCVISPGNAQAGAAWTNTNSFAGNSTSAWGIGNTTAALTLSTTYVWPYVCSQ